jgi:hypothetical protein
MTDKIDIRGMSGGEIYAAISRKENPEEHAKIDAFMERILNEGETCHECLLIGRESCSEHSVAYNAKLTGRGKAPII